MVPERSLCTSRVGTNVADVNKNQHLAEKPPGNRYNGAYGLYPAEKVIAYPVDWRPVRKAYSKLHTFFITPGRNMGCLVVL